MNFEENLRQKAQEVLGGYNETLHEHEMAEIKDLYNLLNEFYLSQIKDGAQPDEQPSSPFNKFRKHMLNFIDENNLEVSDLDEYAAFHYAKGSTPIYSRIKEFDLPGDLIRNQFMQFALREYPELLEEVK